MADEQDNKENREKKTVSDSLRDWGIDVDRFEERARESFDSARGDLSEITGTLRQTLVQAKEIVVGLQKNGAPVAAEIKAGFERAWHEIEAAFRAAREKAKERKEGDAPPPAGGDADADGDATPPEPTAPPE